MYKILLFVSLMFVSSYGYAVEKKAYFAGGCFWCMEESFDQVEGVISTISGYSGGHLKNPKYADVVYTDSGHVEAVEITYDSSIIDYKKLLNIYWKNIECVSHAEPVDRPEKAFNLITEKSIIKCKNNYFLDYTEKKDYVMCDEINKLLDIGFTTSSKNNRILYNLPV